MNQGTETTGLNDHKVKLLPNTRIVSCEVFRDELEHLGIEMSTCQFLDRGLHRHPHDLNRKLRQKIKEVEEEHSHERIILVYGYCGGALENISSRKAHLILVRVHDCIPLLLGHEPMRVGVEGKGIFFLSRGWIHYGKTPYTDYLELREKYGHENALKSCKDLLRMYDTVTFIHTAPDDNYDIIKKSKEFASLFRMRHRERKGDPELLRSLLNGQPNEKVFCIQPGCKVSRKDFDSGVFV